MFSKSSKGSVSAVDSRPIVKQSPPSIISADLRIFGDISSDGEIQIDGAVDGDIRTKTLLVGEGAHIKGEIVAETVHVHGTVSGQIKSRSVNLAKTAHVVGDILHEDLTIETGAFLEGHCKRMTEKKEPVEGKINVLGKDGTLPPGAKVTDPADVSAQPEASAPSSMAPGNDDPKKIVAS